MAVKNLVRKTRYFLRFKYRKGHNIHSPFVYNLFREVFMPKPSETIAVDLEMYKQLYFYGIKRRYASRFCQLKNYLEVSSYVINPLEYNNEDMIIITSLKSAVTIDNVVEDAIKCDKRVTLVVNGINKNRESREWWDKIEDSVVLDFGYFGVIVFDRLLSSKRYKLKL